MTTMLGATAMPDAFPDDDDDLFGGGGDEEPAPGPSSQPTAEEQRAAAALLPVRYVKKAKRIDAQELKRAMRKVLLGGSQRQKQRDNAKDFKLISDFNFSELCAKVPSATRTEQDFSVSVNFVIFLHLCNEHALRLEQQNDGSTPMSDFTIRQDEMP